MVTQTVSQKKKAKEPLRARNDESNFVWRRSRPTDPECIKMKLRANEIL